MKQKLAEKEAQKAAARAAGEGSDDYDEDAVLDPREKARRDRERELNADLSNAADLFGAAALGGTFICHLSAGSVLSLAPKVDIMFPHATKERQTKTSIVYFPSTPAQKTTSSPSRTRSLNSSSSVTKTSLFMLLLLNIMLVLSPHR